MKTIQRKQWTMISLAVCLGASSLQAQLTLTNGLQLWLKADAGVTTNASGLVSSWADQTANGYNVSQSTDGNKPTYIANQINARPVLRFDGTDDYLNNTVANVLTGGQARTVFIVADANGNSGAYGLGGSLFFFRRGGGGFVMGLEQADLGAGTTYIHTDGLAYNHTTANQNAIVANPFLATYRSIGAGPGPANLSEWLNGNSIPVSTEPLNVEGGTTGFTIGNREDIAVTIVPWNGDIAEILVYDSALSSTDRNTVEQYLFVQYGIPEPSTALLLCMGGLLLWRRLGK